MNGKELLIGIGTIHPRYYEEAETEALSTRKRIRRPLLIAAIVALTALLVGCAVVYRLSLEGLTIGTLHHILPRYIDAEGNKIQETEVSRDVLSLQGMAGSPNFEAAREWFEFEQSYDPDKTLLDAADKNPITVSSEYDAYFVYTQEMVDKIDEITRKYGLRLAGEFAGFQNYEMDLFFDALDFDRLHRDHAKIEYSAAYLYACGNFQTEFVLEIPSRRVTGAYRFNGKDYFDTVFSSIGTDGAYEEWTYLTGDGLEVLILAGENSVRVFCDREDAFLSLHLNQGSMTNTEIKEIVNCFDFTVIPRKPNMEETRQKLKESFDSWQAAQETQTNPFLHDDHSYDDIIRRCIENGISSYFYALRDITGDGSPELFLGCGDSFGDVKTMVDGNPTTLWSNGTDRDIRLCEGNFLRYDNGSHHFYMKLDTATGQFVTFLTIGYDLWEEKWYCCEGMDGEQQYISEEEYIRLESAYPVIDLDMKPIEEYPLS